MSSGSAVNYSQDYNGLFSWFYFSIFDPATSHLFGRFWKNFNNFLAPLVINRPSFSQIEMRYYLGSLLQNGPQLPAQRKSWRLFLSLRGPDVDKNNRRLTASHVALLMVNDIWKGGAYCNGARPPQDCAFPDIYQFSLGLKFLFSADRQKAQNLLKHSCWRIIWKKLPSLAIRKSKMLTSAIPTASQFYFQLLGLYSRFSQITAHLRCSVLSQKPGTDVVDLLKEKARLAEQIKEAAALFSSWTNMEKEECITLRRLQSEVLRSRMERILDEERELESLLRSPRQFPLQKVVTRTRG